LKRTDALRLDLLDLQLILAARHVDDDPASNNDLHAVLQIEPQPKRDAAIDDGVKLAAGVLELQIQMSGRRPRQIRHLSHDHNAVRIAPGERVLDVVGQFADRQRLDAIWWESVHAHSPRKPGSFATIPQVSE